jgi:anhydro-N-acetylmuramic acid kinase
MRHYIGLMSGTSLDGLDAVLVEFGPADADLKLHAHRHCAFSPTLRAELLALNGPGGTDELHRAALAANALAALSAQLVDQLLAHSGMAASAVRAIGAHGQTVRHRPAEFDGTGYTLQLNNGALLAERTGIDVVCDFRSRDVAAGGQGAPLVPAFHAALFARAGEASAVLNLGGIANLTLLGEDGAVLGFDCGPANVLLDGWCQRHRGQAFDDGGRWAASGQVAPALLARLQEEPYFQRAPPKSTGRDLFDLDWLDGMLGEHGEPVSTVDVQSTLAELTVQAVARDLRAHAPRTRSLLACGGGALNHHLMERLAAQLPDVAVGTTAERGLGVTQVEAVAFAWLARCFVERTAGNRIEVTGARHPCVLGALYPAA